MAMGVERGTKLVGGMGRKAMQEVGAGISRFMACRERYAAALISGVLMHSVLLKVFVNW